MKPLNSLDIMRVAFQTYAQRASSVLVASLLINVSGFLLSVVAMNVLGVTGIYVYAVASIFAVQLTFAVGILLMAQLERDGEAPEAGDLVKAALARGGALFVLALGYWIGVVIGLIFLLIPGLYLALRWSLSPSALLIRRVGVQDAFKTSSELTRQAMWPTFAVGLMVLCIIYGAPYLLTNAFGGEMAPLEQQVALDFLTTALFAPFFGLAYGELYLRVAGAVAPPMPAMPAPTGPWVGVPQPMGGMAPAGGAPGAFAAAAPGYGAPAQPYGTPPQPYGTPPQPYGAPHAAAPGYGAPAQPYAAPPQPYGAPHAAAPGYGAPAAPAQPYAAPPQPYGAPHAAAPGYGAPAQPYGAPQPYAAPTPQQESSAAPQPGVPAQPYAAPAQPQQAAPYGVPGDHHQQPQAYGAAAQASSAPAQPAPYGTPPQQAYAAPPQASAPQQYGAPPQPGGPAQGPMHPGRETSVAPPGMSS